jgi:hypothetical protein
MAQLTLHPSDAISYALNSDDKLWVKCLTLLASVALFFYLPFLMVWYCFLRYVVTAYGLALQQGYSSSKAWARFFSPEAHLTITPEASAFMDKADDIVLAPFMVPCNLLEHIISPSTIIGGLATVLLITLMGLIFVGIPYKLFSWFQRGVVNFFDRG